MSEEFPHQFLCVTVSPIKGNYSDWWYNGVKKVLEDHYRHWIICEEAGKADVVTHLHVALYVDETRDRVVKNWNQRFHRYGFKDRPGYDKYHTMRCEVHENAYPFGYVLKEEHKKEDSGSDLIPRLREKGAEDYANAPNLKDKAKEREYRAKIERVRDMMVDYVYQKNKAAADSFNRRKHEYESTWCPRPDIWKVQKLAAMMFRDEYDGADRHFINFCTRNGPIIHQYLEDAIAESENFAQEQKDRSHDERALLGKRAREAEAEAEREAFIQHKVKHYVEPHGTCRGCLKKFRHFALSSDLRCLSCCRK